MSDLFVDNIKHQSSQGSGTITIGASGEKIDLGADAGGTFTARPAFFATLSTSQTGLSDNTDVKAQLDTEVLDTDSCYDNSTNYRFTPTVAGEYLIFGALRIASASVTTLNGAIIGIFKNGSLYAQSHLQFSNNYGYRNSQYVSSIINFNGSTDYVELYGRADVTSGTGQIQTGTRISYFGGHRLTGS